MVSRPAGNATLLRAVQVVNVLEPKVLRVEGRLTSVKAEHPKNIYVLVASNPSSIVTFFKDAQ